MKPKPVLMSSSTAPENAFKEFALDNKQKEYIS
jgi:hypothetical protein